MITARLPENEAMRLTELYEYNLLDTAAEQEYDDITQVASDICHMPISVISLIDKDRQWFKSRVGLDAQETDRGLAFCAHAILYPNDMFIVPDPTQDERFKDNPLVLGEPHIGFYAGVPLLTPNGSALGTLCVMDHKPNMLTDEQKFTLKALARVVTTQMELHKKNDQLAAQKELLEQTNRDLTQFAQIVAHDIKAPCNSLAASSAYLKRTYQRVIDRDGLLLLEMMEHTSLHASKMVDGILAHTRTVNNTDIAKSHFTFNQCVADVQALLIIQDDTQIIVDHATQDIYSSISMITQILLNLCSNAIKHNDKAQTVITLDVTKNDDEYIFTVADNGPGIPEEEHNNVFQMFRTLSNSGVEAKGHGIGLATVKRLVEKMNGSIEIISELGKGCEFRFTVAC